jgi:hypothetical protein
MLLLTDGSVIVLSNSDYQTWMRLTPDAQGSYINGTWSLTSRMIGSRLDFASQDAPCRAMAPESNTAAEAVGKSLRIMAWLPSEIVSV